MLFQNDPLDLNSLPTSDENRGLQERSLRAIRNALPVDDWVLRDERIEDAGVDASLEVLENGRFTNCRAQIQLKSTRSPRRNLDGSLSLSVATQNLNYLLNGPSRLYVIFDVQQDSLSFVWAREEARRLDAQDSSWREQETVTLRFREEFNQRSLVQIRERIRGESLLNRQILEIVHRTSGIESVRVCIDPETLRTTDPEVNFQYILEQGISLVNAGNPQRVIDAAEALNLDATQHPRILLVIGYAKFIQSRFLDALSTLSRASMEKSNLSSDDKDFLDHLYLASRYHIGQISMVDFANARSVLQERASISYRVTYRLLAMRDDDRLYGARKPFRKCTGARVPGC